MRTQTPNPKPQTPNPKPQTPNPKPQTAQRFSEVDSLRAVACALVIIAHAEDPSGVILQTFPLGHTGVLMFFAISGFVIPSSLRGTRWEGFKHFAVRRFWRLYPPLWGTLLLMYLVGTRDLSVSQWFSQATMIPRYLGSMLLSPHFWTLEVEFVFYAVSALLFLLVGHLRWCVLLLAYSLCGIGVIFPSAMSGWLHAECLMVMFWGACCREVLQIDFSRWNCLAPIKGVKWVRATVLGLLTGVLVFCPLGGIYFGFYEQDYPQIRDGLALTCAALGFLFWVILRPVRVSWLSCVGRWTYSTYLLHFGVMTTFLRVFRLFSIENPSSVPMIFPSIVIVASFTVGAVAYRWIEKPSDRIGKRLTRRRTA